MLTWLIIALLAAALFLFTKHRRNRMLGGLTAGELVAADNEEQECPVLVSHRLGQKGKLDVLVRASNGAIIPVERKRCLAVNCNCMHVFLSAASMLYFIGHGSNKGFVRPHWPDEMVRGTTDGR